MSEPHILLRKLSPPSGGWERLLARRDAAPGWVRKWAPLAAGSVVAVLVLGTVMPRPRLDVSWPGARGAGAAVVSVSGQRLQPLPSDDPRVRLYWLEGANGATDPRAE
jgi:hypothetical protein